MFLFEIRFEELPAELERNLEPLDRRIANDWAFVTAGSAVLRLGEIYPAPARNRRRRSYRGSAPPRARRGSPRERRARPGPGLLCRCRYRSARRPSRSHAIRTE